MIPTKAPIRCACGAMFPAEGGLGRSDLGLCRKCYEEHVQGQAFLPFDFDGWDPAGDDVSTYYDCTLTRDFGPLKAGQRCEYITLDLEAGTASYLVSQEDEVVPSFKIVLQAI